MSGDDIYLTDPGMLADLGSANEAAKQRAWSRFRAKYAPLIIGFARKHGAAALDADEILQDVLVGLFRRGNAFTYDPAKGKFRSYLRTSVINALRSRVGRNPRGVISLEAADHQPAADLEERFDMEYEKDLLRRILIELEQSAPTATAFKAFKRYAVQGQDAGRVAKELRISIDSVYQSKTRIAQKIRDRALELRIADDAAAI